MNHMNIALNAIDTLTNDELEAVRRYVDALLLRRTAIDNNTEAIIE